MIQRKYMMIGLVCSFVYLGGLQASMRGKMGGNKNYLTKVSEQKEFEDRSDRGKQRYLIGAKSELNNTKKFKITKIGDKLKKTLGYLASVINDKSKIEYITYYNFLLEDLEKSLDKDKSDFVKAIRADRDMGVKPAAPARGHASASGNQASVNTSKEDIEDALEALEDLADNIEFDGKDSKIRNQEDWRKFCDVFADLVGEGKWEENRAYIWDGKSLEKK